MRRSAYLSLISLSEGSRLGFVRHELPGGADRLHFNCLVFGGVAHDDAELASFTAIDCDFCDHLRDVEIQAIGFRAVHDAQATSLFCHALLVDNLRYVIHATWFLLSR